MRLNVALGAAAGLALTAHAASARAPVAPDAPILAAITGFSESRNRFDAPALATFLTADFIEISPRGEIDARDKVLGFYAPEKASPVPPMTFETQDLRRFGDAAIVIGSITYSLPGGDGQSISRMVRAVYMLRRIRGRWLLASTQFTPVPPPKPMPIEHEATRRQ